ncbi:serine/threonine-protein kinase [Cyanobacterium sp. IPPAS B-1200]|uniref:serine/threonine-protein kinase n=1 Tax=Cyanobacterium sp. IPPAS B-1200 TaxID=1562720 RepID=UPI0008527A20|nr:hypothetical protein A5482_14340 [Cyanobacterium sp. IPPAS B-1200]
MNPILEKMLWGIVGEKIGSYRLDKFIGVGGFGGVFQASEIVRNTPVKEVAIKIIPESSDEQLQELLTARALEHPYLIRSYSVGECEFFNTEMLYLAMELANGSLDEKIAIGKLTTNTVKDITIQVASGLTFLHENSRVHRDLKPANILSVNQQWKLSDFGLIRQLNNNSYTQTINTSGTIIYMPPEAFDGEISSAWDMWSLGIMLVEMLTGQLPYNFDNNNRLCCMNKKIDSYIVNEKECNLFFINDIAIWF